jgi:hypothetical protein
VITVNQEISTFNAREAFERLTNLHADNYFWSFIKNETNSAAESSSVIEVWKEVTGEDIFEVESIYMQGRIKEVYSSQ